MAACYVSRCIAFLWGAECTGLWSPRLVLGRLVKKDAAPGNIVSLLTISHGVLHAFPRETRFLTETTLATRNSTKRVTTRPLPLEYATQRRDQNSNRRRARLALSNTSLTRSPCLLEQCMLRLLRGLRIKSLISSRAFGPYVAFANFGQVQQAWSDSPTPIPQCVSRQSLARA